MPRQNRLFTLFLSFASCLHTVKLHVCMLWLTMVLQKPAIARRTIAIELLRRSDQVENYRRRAQSVSAPHFPLAHAAHPFVKSKQPHTRAKSPWSGASATRGRFFLPERTSEPLLTNLLASNELHSCLQSDGPHDEIGRNTCRGSSWTGSVPLSAPRNDSVTALSEDAQDSIKHELQAQRQREASANTGAQPTPPGSPLKKTRLSYTPYGDTHEYTPEPMRSRRSTTRERKSGSYYTPPLSDIDSAGSDVATTQRKRLSFGRTSSKTIPIQDDTEEGAKEEDHDTLEYALANTTATLNNNTEPPRNKRWSACSTDSISTTIRRPSTTTVRTRSKTNGGLLEFRAKTAGPKTPLPTRSHRRPLSLNLPIRPNISPPSTHTPKTASLIPPPTPRQPASFSSSSTTTTTTPTNPSSPPTPHLDADLQYKHRHIFIGTASLHTFLTTLDLLTPTTTSKPLLLKAFATLAAHEQLLARLNSPTPVDWNLVSRTAADVADWDYVVLARTQLGSVSAARFVEAVPFDRYGRVGVGEVVQAWKVVSVFDNGEGGVGGGYRGVWGAGG